MRKHLPTVLPALLSGLVLVAAAPAPAGAATRSAAAPVTTASVTTTQARFGGGFRASRPSFGSRYRSPAYRRPSSYRRSHPFRGFGGSILRALGIAYLVHALFGWGAGGGSPFGLLIVAALVAWIVTRFRRRPYAY
jgi:uncharacterized membrane protein